MGESSSSLACSGETPQVRWGHKEMKTGWVGLVLEGKQKSFLLHHHPSLPGHLPGACPSLAAARPVLVSVSRVTC